MAYFSFNSRCSVAASFKPASDFKSAVSFNPASDYKPAVSFKPAFNFKPAFDFKPAFNFKPAFDRKYMLLLCAEQLIFYVLGCSSFVCCVNHPLSAVLLILCAVLLILCVLRCAFR